MGTRSLTSHNKGHDFWRGGGGGGGTMQLRKTSFIIEDHLMKSLKSCRYLGVTFKHNLLFEKHVQMVKDAATKAEFSMISKLVDLKNYDINLASKLFDTLVSPIMEYGVGHRDLEKIEKINLHFYKLILGQNNQPLTMQSMENRATASAM